MRRFRRMASAVILTAFLAMLLPGSSLGARSLGQLRKQLEDTARQITEVQSKLRPIKRQQRIAEDRLAGAERRLKAANTKLADIQSQLRSTRAKLSATRAELEVIQKRLQERNDLLAARLVDTYKRGSVGYLSVLLEAEDFWDLLSRGYVLRRILQSDVELVEAIKEDQQAVQEYQAALEEQEQKRAGLVREQAAATREAANIKDEHSRILRDIKDERAVYEQKLAELEQNSKQITDLIRSAQRTPKGQARLSQVWRGRFIAPVSGEITSNFGMRFHPILKQYRQHTGVDIASPSGTTIKAAAGGDVIYSGWFGAYGNTVIIDHGGGMTTVYGHCSRILARAGQTVKQGQAIARVGSTGWSTGPHLHFEVRKDGVPVKPF